MAKIRVHELAKELDRSNKEVIDYLTKKGVEVKSHMSSLEDVAAETVRKAFSGKKTETASPAKSAENKSAESGAEKPKKKNIIRVFRSQNASGTIPEHRPRKPEAAKKPAMNKPETAETKPVQPRQVEKTPEIKTEVKTTEIVKENVQPEVKPTVQPAAAQPTGTQQQRPVQQRPAGSQPYSQNRPQGQTNGQSRPQGQSQNRPQGQGYNGQSRPQGQGYNGQSRPQGQGYNGQNRPQGQGQNRPQGQGYNGQSRPQGQGYNGQSRPQGQGYNGQNRPQGQGYNGQSRPQGQGYNSQSRPQGQGYNGQSRPQGQGYNGQSRPQGQGYNGQSRPQGQGYNQNRTGGQGNGQNRYNNQNRSDRPGFQSGRPQNGSRPFGQGGRPQGSRPAEVPDAPLVKKPSRDVRKDSKDRDKKDFKDNSKRPNQGNRPNQGRRQFNRIPRALEKPAQKQKVEEKKEVVTEITIPEKLTIRELAEAMKMQPSVIVKKLFLEGTMVTVNHEIDFDKAAEIALDYEIIAEQEVKVDVIEELLKEEDEDDALLTARPPVVCVMGHVDHGKTSLLDSIRNTHVTDREAGGITQHIGAYTVSIDGQKITFLDTPGHEAFTAMRMRGANATDIAILVVAADDGVMPQTVEAINHAKAAGVEIIVAINKIDKPSANVERVKQELSEYELIPEDWGGTTVFVPVSAHSGEGIDTLLEMIVLTSEVLELKANANRKARGLVIEAQLDKGKGPVATILVQKGTLYVGDFIACGASSGKVRAMMDDKGRRVKEAGPSTPVEILGLSEVPNAGEILVATDSDKSAKEFAATFISENKNKLLDDTKSRMSLDDLFSQIQEGNIKELPIVVKADVQGSVEAVKQSLVKLSNEEVVVKVIHGGVGAITESDVNLASASNAIVIGFNVRPDATAKATAEQEGIDLRTYKVIYQAIEDVEAAMKGMLDAVYEEKVIGHAEIRQIFKASAIGNIAGSYILDGEFQRGASVRIKRGEEQVYEGKLASLKRFKDDVKEVKAGFECGLVFDGFETFQEEDIVEAYIMVEVPR